MHILANCHYHAIGCYVPDYWSLHCVKLLLHQQLCPAVWDNQQCHNSLAHRTVGAVMHEIRFTEEGHRAIWTLPWNRKDFPWHVETHSHPYSPGCNSGRKHKGKPRYRITDCGHTVHAVTLGSAWPCSRRNSKTANMKYDCSDTFVLCLSWTTGDTCCCFFCHRPPQKFFNVNPL
jgi:hypothetical protein